MKNKDIRIKALECNVKLWQIAKEINIAPETFSRRLRKELSSKEKAEIISVIEFLKQPSKEGE